MERPTDHSPDGSPRGYAWFAAALTGAAALPSLFLPFVSDDWVHLWAADNSVFLENPFEFFRPLCSLSYWVDWSLWGRTPAAFHLTEILLAAIVGGCVVLTVHRFTGDRTAAGLTGVAFALHPYHVSAVSWISARSDLMSAIFVLVTLWAFERWRQSARRFPVPLLAFLFYELAMLTKEAGVVVPAVLAAIALFRLPAWPPIREILFGYLPMFAMGVLHFLLVRPWFMEGGTMNHLKWLGAWRGNLLAYGSTSVLPPPPEIFEQNSWAWGFAAAGIVTLLAGAAWRRNGHLPRAIWPAAAAFLMLLGPSLIGFQLRYFFLPSAASLFALVLLLRAAGPRVGGTVAALLAIFWIGVGVDSWRSEFEAGRVSTRLIEDMVELSQVGGVETLVPIGIPHRVRGVPVTTDFQRVIPFLGGGTDVTIQTAGEFDFPDGRSDAVLDVVTLEADPGLETHLELQVMTGPYSRMVRPLRSNRLRPLDNPWGKMELQIGEESEGLSLRWLHSDRALGAVWTEGQLIPLH